MPQKRVNLVLLGQDILGYDNSINDQRRLRRKYERRWRKSGSPEDKKVYLDQKTLVNQLIDKAKTEYYKVKLYVSNVKGVFQIVNTLLNKNIIRLPTGFSQTFCVISLSHFSETRFSKSVKVLKRKLIVLMIV